MIQALVFYIGSHSDNFYRACGFRVQTDGAVPDSLANRVLSLEQPPSCVFIDDGDRDGVSRVLHVERPPAHHGDPHGLEIRVADGLNVGIESVRDIILLSFRANRHANLPALQWQRGGYIGTGDTGQCAHALQCLLVKATDIVIARIPLA